jgi:hypothetical protein
MTIEWMEYPLSLGSEDELMTISWRDGSSDVVPSNNGDGETIYQLPKLMDEIFKVENFNCFAGQSGRFIDEYPTLFRSDTGVLVLRVTSEERFMNAFICKSKDAADCLLSWFNGEVTRALGNPAHPVEGSTDFHWVSVREVLAFIGAGLLDDFPPIVFDLEDSQTEDPNSEDRNGPVNVDLPWWSPPSRVGPAFAYPAILFDPKSYESEPSIEKLAELSVAVSVTHCLLEEQWVRILQGCINNSLATRIVDDDNYRNRFEIVKQLAVDLGKSCRKQWKDLD